MQPAKQKKLASPPNSTNSLTEEKNKYLYSDFENFKRSVEPIKPNFFADLRKAKVGGDVISIDVIEQIARNGRGYVSEFDEKTRIAGITATGTAAAINGLATRISVTGARIGFSRSSLEALQL